mmetsp:Transcript_23565/g.39519  ORF Transcript_23565/g.39519 Transcript_23565/m.39519 type:complete len:440 (+) Transcript_23565:2995-4314(+)
MLPEQVQVHHDGGEGLAGAGGGGKDHVEREGLGVLLQIREMRRHHLHEVLLMLEPSRRRSRCHSHSVLRRMHHLEALLLGAVAGCAPNDFRRVPLDGVGPRLERLTPHEQQVRHQHARHGLQIIDGALLFHLLEFLQHKFFGDGLQLAGQLFVRPIARLRIHVGEALLGEGLVHVVLALAVEESEHQPFHQRLGACGGAGPRLDLTHDLESHGGLGALHQILGVDIHPITSRKGGASVDRQPGCQGLLGQQAVDLLRVHLRRHHRVFGCSGHPGQQRRTHLIRSGLRAIRRRRMQQHSMHGSQAVRRVWWRRRLDRLHRLRQRCLEQCRDAQSCKACRLHLCFVERREPGLVRPAQGQLAQLGGVAVVEKGSSGTSVFEHGRCRRLLGAKHAVPVLLQHGEYSDSAGGQLAQHLRHVGGSPEASGHGCVQPWERVLARL